MYQLMCYAERVFPRPTMSLHIGGSEVNNSKVQVYEKGNIFDIKVVAEVPRLESPEEFSCELHIPQANYTVRKEAIYYPVNEGTMLQEHLCAVAIKTIIFVFFHLLLFTG
ncbi:unnamed protein product [Callosobruchus maculatus]|uniref:Immunoglobulin C1-set domain-containing protein n=2 Tax=Callosobruchus maculatus TaxID=64391 RepID=A0A653C439_CALMS|nr:unnamed protein product [Callosobruchus maculatus]